MSYLAQLTRVKNHLSRSRRSDRRAGRRVLIEELETRQLLSASVNIVKDIAVGGSASLPPLDVSNNTVAQLNGFVYFAADDGVHGMELWRTDGTEANTTLVIDLFAGASSSSPAHLLAANGSLYFSAQIDANTQALIRTDGTAAGTVALTTSPSTANPLVPLAATNTLVFGFRGAAGASSDGELWKTDGSVIGTAAIRTGLSNATLDAYTTFTNEFYFAADTATAVGQIWKSNGTVAGTDVVVNSLASVDSFATLNGNLYFSAKLNQAGSTSALWKYTPGQGNPVLVQSTDVATDVKNVTTVGSQIYFTGFRSDTGTELWVSDGTNGGTHLVSDIRVGITSSNPDNLIAVDGSVYFTAYTDADGEQIWRSNGTAESTVQVRKLGTGNAGITIEEMINIKGLLVFSADVDGESHLWISNGTADGTVRLDAFLDDQAVVNASNFVQVGNQLYFAAENTLNGRELFVFTLDAAAAVPVLTGPSSVTLELRPTISWNAVANASQYEVWIKNQSTGEARVIVTAVSTTSFTPTFDLGIGNFTVWVRTLGTNGSVSSAWTAPRNFRIKTRVTMNSVVVNQATAQATISWQALAGAVKYDVWVDRLDVPTSQIVRNTNVTATSLTTATLPVGRYRVWVRGAAANGTDGSWSLAQDFSISSVPVITGGVNPTFDTTPTVSWTAVAGASSYEVYILAIHGNYKILHQKNIVDTSFTWPEFPAGPYRFWVKATGATSWSDPVEIDTRGRTDVLAPTGTTTNPRPTISWRPVDGAVRYELWVNQLGVKEKVLYSTTLTTNSYTPTADLASGNYRIWVRAVSSTATAPWSAYVDFSVAEVSSPDDSSGLIASVFAEADIMSRLESEQQTPVVVLAKDATMELPSEAPASPSSQANRQTLVARRSSAPAVGGAYSGVESLPLNVPTESRTEKAADNGGRASIPTRIS